MTGKDCVTISSANIYPISLCSICKFVVKVVEEGEQKQEKEQEVERHPGQERTGNACVALLLFLLSSFCKFYRSTTNWIVIVLAKRAAKGASSEPLGP